MEKNPYIGTESLDPTQLGKALPFLLSDLTKTGEFG
jgi:hypothetical protein